MFLESFPPLICFLFCPGKMCSQGCITRENRGRIEKQLITTEHRRAIRIKNRQYPFVAYMALGRPFSPIVSSFCIWLNWFLFKVEKIPHQQVHNSYTQYNLMYVFLLIKNYSATTLQRHELDAQPFKF